jgi:hypothetical protein
MKTLRKVQFTAAAVIANGAIALGLMSPRVAHAADCSPSTCAIIQAGANGYCKSRYGVGVTSVGLTCQEGHTSARDFCSNAQYVDVLC